MMGDIHDNRIVLRSLLLLGLECSVSRLMHIRLALELRALGDPDEGRTRTFHIDNVALLPIELRDHRQLSRSTYLPFLAEGEGFEPPVEKPHCCFRDSRNKPLGHPTIIHSILR